MNQILLTFGVPAFLGIEDQEASLGEQEYDRLLAEIAGLKQK